MAETIMGASGQNLMHITTGGAALITGSVSLDNAQINVDVTVGDYVSIVGSPNYSLPIIGSVQVSSLVGALPAGTALLGSVIASPVGYQPIIGSPNYSLPVIGSMEVSNNISVQITTDDYISIVGSPNYNLPTIGSVEISTIRTMPTTTVTATNLDIRDLAPTQDYVSIVGSPNYSVPVIGSVQVSSIVGALPAGTALLGSVIASPIGTQTIIGSVEISNSTLNVDVTVSDYISIIGSPNYSLPVIGSVEISTIRTMPTTTVTATDLDIRNLVSATDSVNAIGSVQVSSVVGALPAGTNIIGSVAADIQKFGVSLPAGTNVIGNIGSIGAGILGSVEISTIRTMPTTTVTATNLDIRDLTSASDSVVAIGSVQVSSIVNYAAWTGIGSIVPFDASRDGSAITFDWVGALTGSVMAIPATGSRFNVTDVFCSASGQGIVTLFFNADNTSNRIAKGTLANFGGFVSNYSKPLPGPINGSLMITTAATGFTPLGTATVTVFQSA